MVLAYLIPILNISIIILMNNPIGLGVYGIVINTNACFLAAVFGAFQKNINARRLLKIVWVAVFSITLLCFGLMVGQEQKDIEIFSIEIYRYWAIISSVFAIFFALCVKYDESKAKSIEMAKESMKINEIHINGKDIKL